MDIGMIGGADGPTSIFVMSAVSWIAIGAFAVLVLALTLYFILRAQRKTR